MSIDNETLQSIIYNPSYAQKVILEELENNNMEIGTATNPFLSLIEVAVSTSCASIQKTQQIIRKQFPSMATDMSDLLLHLTEDDIEGIYYTPSSTYLTIEVNALDMKNSAYKPDNQSYRETMIPLGTTVTVSNFTFTFLNNILIRLYDGTEQTYVESMVNENDIAYNDISILESKLIHNSDNIPFITFKVPIKQVTKTTLREAVNKSMGFNLTHTLTDKFYYAEVYYSGVNTGNVLTKINQTFTETYLDPYNAQVVISVKDNEVNFKIPSLYITSGLISGTVTIVVYETKGKSYLPLNHFKRDKFEYVIADSDLRQAATLPNINIAISSDTEIDGGTNGLSLEELRTNIINHTTGNINVPITNYQIEKIGTDYNYKIFNVEDVLTQRVFIATKELDNISSSLIRATPDTFNNTAKITLLDYGTYFPDLVKDEDFIIKSNTIFKENNGILEVISPEDKKVLNEMSITNKIEHLKTNKYFYNVFTYIISKSDSVTNCRIYHMDNPSLNNVRILAKNQNLQTINCYLEKHDIKRIDGGYRIYAQITGDDGFNKLSQDQRHVQCSIELISGDTVNFQLTYDVKQDVYTADILTDDLINSDNRLTINNGTSNISTKLVNLETKVYFYTFITDKNNYDSQKYLVDYIDYDHDNISVLSRESVTLTFGKEITYLWNKIFNTYTDRKYKTYSEDVYKTYEADVYEKDIDGALLWVKTAENKISTVKLHSKGDYVLDDKGEKVILHKKGESILDENGEPIIDSIPGVVRYIDLLMLEYEFMVADGDINNNLRTLILGNFENILFNQLPNMNNNLLERTTVYFRASRSTTPIELNIKGTTSIAEYRVTPKVTLYVESNTNVDLTTQETYKTTIGKIINKELTNKTINLTDIRNKIINALDIKVLGVTIENISKDNSEIIHVNTTDNSLTLDKSILYTEYKEIVVAYNLELVITKINN